MKYRKKMAKIKIYFEILKGIGMALFYFIKYSFYGLGVLFKVSYWKWIGLNKVQIYKKLESKL